MASSAQMQAGRDAADYAMDRHDPRFAHYRAPADRSPLEPWKQKALDDALAQIDRAFGPNSIERRRARVSKALAPVQGRAA
jgi:hypothetical protein